MTLDEKEEIMVEVSGIMHGKMIELQEDLGLPDGEAVKVIVRQVLPPGEAFAVPRRMGRCGRGVGSVAGRSVSKPRP